MYKVTIKDNGTGRTMVCRTRKDDSFTLKSLYVKRLIDMGIVTQEEYDKYKDTQLTVLLRDVYGVTVTTERADGRTRYIRELPWFTWLIPFQMSDRHQKMLNGDNSVLFGTDKVR